MKINKCKLDQVEKRENVDVHGIQLGLFLEGGPKSKLS